MAAVTATSTVASTVCTSAMPGPGQVDVVLEDAHVPHEAAEHDVADHRAPEAAPPAACSAQSGRCSPNQGTTSGSTSSTSPPSAMPPRPKVREVKPTTLAISSGVSPQAEYRR